ncbi:ArnT family glycosyltransferase [Paractinoplanes rishiriensis]|uniref:ArnT family glycosyltransferase n=1 Tax=Paractinoplanes rishiriensis TaxID=1050105 RepID=UPI001EF1F00C|nr:glycosyltransferase family 39 protein [Actinoplanes rishiriensis]
MIDTGAPRPPMARWPVGIIAAGVTALLIATSDRYDYHRDELYFRMLAEHPQWGYVDQPPFTPMLARLGIEIFGDTVWAMRVPAAVLLGVAAIVAAVLAREFGGRAVAQSIAAAGVLSAVPLAAAHVTSTATADLPIWLGVILFVVRALRGNDRAWLAAGLVAGLGLYNKHLVVLLLLSLAAGILVAGPRRVLLSKWLWAGVGLAVLVGLPNLLYQIANDFPQARMAEALSENKGGESRAGLVPLQFALLAVPPIWIAGIVRLARDRQVRALAVAYPLILILTFVVGGQPYYPLGLLFGLYCAGAVATESWLAGRRTRQVLAGAGIAVLTLMGVVSGLPLLPRDQLAGNIVTELNPTVAEQIGWPEYVEQVAAVHAALPAEERAGAVLIAGNYGEAGMLDRFGPRHGLPPVYSGHNELHNFGPPPDDRTVAVVVSQSPPTLLAPCDNGPALRNSLGVENEEQQEGRIYVCRPAEPWRTLWPKLQRYS